MRITQRILTSLLALAGLFFGGTFVVGGMIGASGFLGAGSLGDVMSTAGYGFTDNSVRFLGGIFFVTGLGFAYCLTDVERKLPLYYFLLMSVFLGGTARIIGWVASGVVQSTIVPTIIELAFPAAIFVLHRFTQSSGVE